MTKNLIDSRYLIFITELNYISYLLSCAVQRFKVDSFKIALEEGDHLLIAINSSILSNIHVIRKYIFALRKHFYRTCFQLRT